MSEGGIRKRPSRWSKTAFRVLYNKYLAHQASVPILVHQAAIRLFPRQTARQVFPQRTWQRLPDAARKVLVVLLREMSHHSVREEPDYV